MTTTVQVRDETRRLLERLKKQMVLFRYDEVIRRLARSKAGIPDSLFRVCRVSRRFVREKEDEHRFYLRN
jgi:hypothetical protein